MTSETITDMVIQKEPCLKSNSGCMQGRQHATNWNVAGNINAGLSEMAGKQWRGDCRFRLKNEMLRKWCGSGKERGRMTLKPVPQYWEKSAARIMNLQRVMKEVEIYASCAQVCRVSIYV